MKLHTNLCFIYNIPRHVYIYISMQFFFKLTTQTLLVFLKVFGVHNQKINVFRIIYGFYRFLR